MTIATGENRTVITRKLRILAIAGTVAALSSLQGAVVLPEIPSIQAGKFETPPQIDGRIHEAEWAAAASASGFTRFEELLGTGSRVGTTPGTPAAQTYAWLGYDDHALYVAFRCEEPAIKDLVADASGRDSAVSRDDCVELFIAPGTYGAWYYHLLVNSEGVIQDQLSRLSPFVLNNAWDGEIEVATSVGDGEWRVELAVPWYNFGEHLDDGGWLVQFCRGRRAAGTEFSSWSFANGNFHNVNRFGKMARPEVDFSRYRGIRLFDVTIPGYGFEDGVYSYRVTGAVENRSASSRKLELVFKDRPATGEEGQNVRLAVELAASDSTTFDVVMPVKALGPRTLALRLLDKDVGEPVFVTAFPEERFPAPAQVFLDRHYYTREANARAVAVTTLPQGAEGLFMAADLAEGPSLRVPLVDTRRTALEIPLGNLPVGNYEVALRVEDASGSLVVSQDTVLKKLPPAPEGIHEVKVDKDRLVILLDGEPFFPICIYNIPPDYLEECAEAGFNMTLRWGGERLSNFKTVEEKQAKVKEYLDAVHGAGMLAMEYPTGFRYLSYSTEDFASKMRAFIEEDLPVILSVSSRHPAVIAYYVLDEPSEPHRHICKEFIAKIREHDPYRPSYILFSTGVRHWPDVYDFAGRDYYFRNHAPLITVHSTAVKEVAAAARARVAYWHVPLCESDSSRLRGQSWPVTGPEQRAQTYMAIIGGVKGMLWWIWPPRYEDNWAMLKQMAGELKVLSPALLEPTPPQRVAWDPRDTAEIVQAVVKVHDGKSYLIAGNSIETPVELTFEVPAGWADQATVMFEDRQVKVRNRRFTERFEGYGRHVYLFEGGWPDGGTLTLHGTRSLAPEQANAEGEEDKAPKRVNLIHDPGFESEADWKFSSTGKREGVAEGMLAPDEDNEKESFLVIRRHGDEGAGRFRGWPVRLKPHTRYLFGVKARVSGAGDSVASVYLHGTYPKGSYMKSATLCRPRNQTPELDPYVRTFTTQDEPLTVTPVIEFAGGKGTAWFDDIMLYEGEKEGRNRIGNGGFEQDVPLRKMAPAWNLGGAPVPGSIGGEDGLLRYESSDAFEGQRSFFLAQGSSLKANLRGPFKKDEPYVFSLYMKAQQPGAKVHLQVGWSTHVTRQVMKVDVPLQWKRFVFPTAIEQDLPSTFALIRVEGGAPVLVDAVQLEPGTEPTEFVAE